MEEAKAGIIGVCVSSFGKEKSNCSSQDWIVQGRGWWGFDTFYDLGRYVPKVYYVCGSAMEGGKEIMWPLSSAQIRKYADTGARKRALSESTQLLQVGKARYVYRMSEKGKYLTQWILVRGP